MNFELSNWDNLKTNGKWSLLLGNGFSINVSSHFGYSTIFEKSKNKLTQESIKLFSEFKTTNFEEVLRYLEHSKIILNVINKPQIELNNLSDNIKSSLIQTLSVLHPHYLVNSLSSGFNKMGNEFKYFNCIFTTNYDLHLYWCLTDHLQHFIDFFKNGFFSENWSLNNKTKIFYLHGALHLYNDSQGDIKKVQRTLNKTIIEQVGDNLKDFNQYPKFITEGKYQDKFQKIKDCPYLSFCLKNLENNSDNLFIFGHTLNPDYEQHLIDAINKSNTKKRIVISLYIKDQIENEHREEMLKFTKMFKNHDLFFINSKSVIFGVNHTEQYYINMFKDFQKED